MTSFLVAFITAMAFAAILTPIVRHVALRIGAVAEASGRHVHAGTIPRLGGVAICFALFAPILGLFFVEAGVAVAIKANPAIVFGLGVGGAAMCIVGVIDDVRGVRALYKLACQILVAALAYGCGFRIESVHLPLIGDLSMGIFALPVTAMWIVGVVNAVNLIDGLDGLAAGVAFCAGLTNLVVAYVGGGVISALLMASMLGALAGFLIYNFNPAKIFMGDSGSYLLGYVLAVTPLVGPSQKGSAAVALLVPIVALGVPIFDTLFTILRRFLEKRPIFSPDRGHVHHRLLDVGLTHRRAVLALYATSVVFTAASIAIYLGRSWQVGIALLIASITVIGLARFAGYFSVLNLRQRRKQRIRSRETELLRREVPELVTALSKCHSQTELLECLVKFAARTELSTIEIVREDEVMFTWAREGGSNRTIPATMLYPLGHDATKRASVRISVPNDFEALEMAPQTEILLQVVADLLATNLRRLDSPLGPPASVRQGRTSSATHPQRVASSPAKI